MHSTPAPPTLPSPAGPQGPRRRRARSATKQDRASLKLFGWMSGIRWSVSFVGFLLYIVALVTSRFPFGTEAMALAILALPTEKGKFSFPMPGKLLLGFVVWVFVGYLISPYKALVWLTTVETMKMIAIYVIAVNVLTDWRRVRFFVLFFLCAYLVYPGRGSILAWSSGSYTIDGRAIWLYIYENPNDLAGLTFFPLGCALWMMSERGHKWARTAALASAAVCMFVIVITQSRGAMLALIPVAALSLAGHHKKLRATLAGLLLVGVVALFAPDDVMERFATLVTSDSIEEADPENSAASRWATWGVAVDVFKSRPVTGWGWGAYHLQHGRETRGRQDVIITARGQRDTHSTYLRVLGETGFVGLLLFLSMLAVTIQRVGRASRAIKRFDRTRASQLTYLRNALIGFLLAGVFASYANLAFLYVHMALLWAVASLALMDAKGASRRAPAKRPPSWATPAPLDPRYARPG